MSPYHLQISRSLKKREVLLDASASMMSGLNFYQGSQQMPVLHAMQLPDPLSHKVKILVGNFPRSD